ncbi:MAG: hypothetical protein P4L10_16290 [Acidobacteriaceae bacterium]|nr:hypothetical protein [Acidobacteriaceae bacterium]
MLINPIVAKINKWTIDFAYEYGSAFTDNLKDTARLELVNFGFEFQFKFSADGTTERFYPEALYIDMGSSKLTFNNSPLFLSLVSFGFNVKPLAISCMFRVDPSAALHLQLQLVHALDHQHLYEVLLPHRPNQRLL